MTWTLFAVLMLALALACATAWHRSADLRRQREAIAERGRDAARQAVVAPLQVPTIDLAKCLGCGTCVTACPEDGVLQLVHGQAAVVNGSACVGHARCVAECPVGAVALGFGDLAARRDVPALDAHLQAVGNEGVFLVGEVTARSLVRSATEQGARVAATLAGRPRGDRARAVLDTVIVGAGPGGLACALG
jgi:thioredoxin reductase (NADPH)